MEHQKELISPETHKQQSSTLNKVREFKSPMFFYEINSELIENLKGFYKKKGNNDNTIATMAKNFKKYLHIANKRGIKSPVDFTDIKTGSFKGNRTFLSEDEIKRLYEYWCNPYCNENYKEIISMFLFSCFTGLRYSDVIKLTTENIKERLLQYIQNLKIKKENFFEIVGLSYSNFKGIQKNSGLNSDAIGKILSIYNNINLYWLILGKGEMLLNNLPDQNKSEVNEPIANNYKGLQNDKEKIIHLLEEQVRELRKDKKMLYKIINK